MKHAIEITNLKKTYKDKKSAQEKEALKGVDLSIPEGAFFGLLGPNGAGKSTLINILAGLTNKTSGIVTICGHDIETAMRAARRSIGIVPQELVLDTFFTVREALEITAGYYGVPQPKRRTDEIIAAMGLSDKADSHARKLSGGMRRRLLIAKALVHSPKVLVLDEPTAGVDVELRTQLWNYVKQLNQQGTTILLTTHYLEEAEELCDQIAIINHGEVIARDSKYNLMRKLDNKKVTIRFSHPPASLPATLQSENISLNAAGEVIFRYQPSTVNLQELMNALNTAGLSILDVTTKEADLQDVFTHLTSSNIAA